VAGDLDEYQAIALKLVADRERRRDLRATMRDRLRASPLGQTEAFARDFYDMLARATAEGPPAAGRRG
jgi:predicted O-linked N-acetylglucosamine transferase (SPINDLY family)